MAQSKKKPMNPPSVHHLRLFLYVEMGLWLEAQIPFQRIKKEEKHTFAQYLAS
jgi:hypothetical protein